MDLDRFILWIKRTEKFLGVEIDAANVEEWTEVSTELSGLISIPKKVKLSTPDVFDGRDISILDMLHKISMGSPSLIVYLEKEEVHCDGSSWICVYKDDFLAHRSIDFLNIRENKRGDINQSDVFNGDTSVFWDEDEAENEADGNISGSESGDELARRLVRSLPTLNEVRDDIAKLIDKKNYSVTVDADRGLAITYWRTTQRNTKMQQFHSSAEKLKKHKARRLHNSFSMTFTNSGLSDYVTEAIAWQQWHSSWLYGTTVNVPLKAGMLTPTDVARMEGTEDQERLGADRSAIISGSDASCSSGNAESSGDESTSSDDSE